MKELGFVTALVSVLCLITFLAKTPSEVKSELQDANLSNSSTYAATIKAVRATTENAAGAERRRKWAIGLQSSSYQRPNTFENAAYSTEGANAEILVVSVDSVTSVSCTAFAQNSDAASVGFTSIKCRDASDGAVYDVPIRAGLPVN